MIGAEPVLCARDEFRHKFHEVPKTCCIFVWKLHIQHIQASGKLPCRGLDHCGQGSTEPDCACSGAHRVLSKFWAPLGAYFVSLDLRQSFTEPGTRNFNITLPMSVQRNLSSS